MAFNAVAKSNLLLAEHPDDEDRRVVVVGKGSFARKPQSFEFNLGTLMFTANDERFEVPNVQAIQFGELAVEDLVGSEPEKVDHSQVGQASSMIRLKLPVDGQWHLARPIIDACAEEGLSERTVKRAKVKLGLEHSKTKTVPAEALWRWPDGTSEGSTLDVPSGLSDLSRGDRGDTKDIGNDGVPTEGPS